jgi:hypothetical protein
VPHETRLLFSLGSPAIERCSSSGALELAAAVDFGLRSVVVATSSGRDLGPCPRHAWRYHRLLEAQLQGPSARTWHDHVARQRRPPPTTVACSGRVASASSVSRKQGWRQDMEERGGIGAEKWAPHVIV